MWLPAKRTTYVLAVTLFGCSAASDSVGPDSAQSLQSIQRLQVELEDITAETSPDGSAILFNVTLTEEWFSSDYGPQDRIAVTVTGSSGKTIETLLVPRTCPKLSLNCDRITVRAVSAEAREALRSRAGELPGLWEDRGTVCSNDGTCYEVNQTRGVIWLLGPEPQDVISAAGTVASWPGVEFAYPSIYTTPPFPPVAIVTEEFGGGLLLESANLGDSIVVEYVQPDGSRLVASHSF